MNGTTLILAIALSVVAALCLIMCGALVGYYFRRKRPPVPELKPDLKELRAIGELSVFKAVTKEIVTQTDHCWGEVGRKYLRWIISQKKMAIIFEFEIDFRYDLRRSDFEIIGAAGDSFILRMPPCFPETNIRNIEFYDEQHSRVLPWLLPDLLNGFFGDGFSPEDKDKLFLEAKARAEQQATKLIKSLSSEVQSSAKETLQAIARAFGAKHVAFEWFETMTTKPVAVQMNEPVGASDRSS